MTPIRLAGCIIFNSQGKILLMHRNKNGKQQWETPGGKVNKGEDDESAAIRELLEETGCHMIIIKKLGEADFFEKDILFHYVWFEGIWKNPKKNIILEKGFDDYKYLPIDKFNDLYDQLSEGTKKLLTLLLK